MSTMKTLTVGGNTYDVFDDGSVRFDSNQTLTAEQKALARENIGAGSGVYVLGEGETEADVPEGVDVLIDPNGEPEAAEYNRVNVRDYGAVGDGVADDRQAIVDAFAAALTMLPCEVYFPAGIYGISDGITVEMAYGTGGLLVRGAGRDITTIKYLESYNPDVTGSATQWYAIRIWPVGMPNTAPTNDEDYLHDISYTGLSVYDPDPIAHAWNTDKGDPKTEETHGFDVQCCKRVSITDCSIINVGDEAIDVCDCTDVIVMNNHLVGCPAAGSAGGAISIGNGCTGVVISGNTINGSAADETLEDGTVLTKRNYGIALESLSVPVSDVVVTGNTIKGVRGSGIHISASNAGSEITKISVTGNVLTDCYNGIKIADSNYVKGNIIISDNIISGCAGELSDEGYAIYTGSQAYNMLVSGNKFQDIMGVYAARIAVIDLALVVDNLFENIGASALFTAGDVVVRNCMFSNIGTVNATTQAIMKYSSGTNKLTVSGCRLTGIQHPKGIANVDIIENTVIELANGGMAFGSATLSRVIGGQFNGYFAVSSDRAIIQGLTIYAATCATHAITIRANGVSVTGCNIYCGGSYKAIYETDGYTGNLVANNIVDGTLFTGSALIWVDNEGSLCANNIDMRTGSVVPENTIATDDHINSLIDAKLGVIENGSY